MHFSLLVIGDDIDGYLYKYEQYSKDGTVTSFMEFVEDSYGSELAKQHVCESFSLTDFLEEYNYMTDGKTIGCWHNPQGHFDNYKIGGRWSGYFKLKPGEQGFLGDTSILEEPRNLHGYADSCFLHQVDIAGMQQDAAKQAGIEYDGAQQIINDRTLIMLDDLLQNNDSYAARQEYMRNKVVFDLNMHNFQDHYLYHLSREDFIQFKIDCTMVSHAMLVCDSWHENPRPRHIYTQKEAQQQKQWAEFFWKQINSLDPNTRLTLLDCHS